MFSLYQLSVFVHILSVMIWVGGMLFLVMVVVPVLRDPDVNHLSARILQSAGKKFRNVGWACFGLIIVTGFLNITGRYGSMAIMSDPDFWTSTFGSRLAMKISLFALILVMSAIHDFFVGPRATKLLMENPDNPAAAQVRKSASWVGRINLLLGLIVVYLAVSMIRG